MKVREVEITLFPRMLEGTETVMLNLKGLTLKLRIQATQDLHHNGFETS